MTDRIQMFGTHAALVAVSDAAEARVTAEGLRTVLAERVTAVVPGSESVLVRARSVADVSDLPALVQAALDRIDTQDIATDAHTVVIPVRYDGADLAEVAALLGVSADEVVTRHSEPLYTVDFLGFAPGFPYLSGLDPFLASVPRLDTPRTRVPAGAVGLAAGKTCVYPTSSPGGWRILGSTSMRLFDPSDESRPTALAAGDTVRFQVTR